jgi:outer membrane immunogenic protein
MGSRNVNFTTTPLFLSVAERTDHIKQDVNMGTVRVNYTFGAPVVAKY